VGGLYQLFELVVKWLVWLVAVWWSWLLRGLLLWLCSVVVRSVLGRSTNKKTNSHLVACWSGAPPKAGTWGRRNYILNTRVTATTTENKNNGYACFRQNGVFRLLLVLSVVPVVSFYFWGTDDCRSSSLPQILCLPFFLT
jgi:hypothetical protein